MLSSLAPVTDRTPPVGFVRSLELLDPFLSVRWGAKMGKWVIERKGVIRNEELRYLISRSTRLERWIRNGNRKKAVLETYKQCWEELQAARAGRRVILFPEHLNAETYNLLCVSDIKRYGGYSRMADEIERRELAAQEKLDKKQSEERVELFGEYFSILKFMVNRRQVQMDHGERKLVNLLGCDWRKAGGGGSTVAGLPHVAPKPVPKIQVVSP